MMNAKTVRKMKTLVLVLFVVATGAALAQAPDGPPPAPGGRGGRFNREEWAARREEMRARMDERLREALGATKDEWEVLGPMVRDANDKRRELTMGAMGGMGRVLGRPEGRFGRPGREGRGPEGQEPGAEVENDDSAAGALAKALENKETPAAEIKEKLEACRKERATKEAELKASQDALRKVVTQRQEALLVLMGTLD